VGAYEVDAVAPFDGPQPQGHGQMGLPHARRPQQEHVGGMVDEGQDRQFLDLALVDGRLEAEVKLL
jgi:hypothetical protein